MYTCKRLHTQHTPHETQHTTQNTRHMCTICITSNRSRSRVQQSLGGLLTLFRSPKHGIPNRLRGKLFGHQISVSFLVLPFPNDFHARNDNCDLPRPSLLVPTAVTSAPPAVATHTTIFHDFHKQVSNSRVVSGNKAWCSRHFRRRFFVVPGSSGLAQKQRVSN